MIERSGRDKDEVDELVHQCSLRCLGIGFNQQKIDKRCRNNTNKPISKRLPTTALLVKAH